MKNDILISAFVNFRTRLRSFAAGIVGNDDADDILHDAFCRMWSSHPQLDSETEALKLSYRVVRNSAIDALRRSKSHPTVPIEEGGRDCGTIEEPENDSADEDTYQAVIALSRRVLGQRQFEVFRLHDIEGQTYDEIAASLCLSVENVRVILSRARKTIRDIYRKNNPDSI